MEIIVTRRDEDTPLAIEGVADREQGVSAVAVFGEVWGLYAIAQEGGILPILRSYLCPIYGGRLQRQPGPSLRRPSQSTGDYLWGPGNGRLQ